MTGFYGFLTMILGALLSGGLIGAFLNHLRESPKAKAEARRIGVETDSTHISSLERIIDRHERRIQTLEDQIQDCHKDRDLALTAARFLWDKLSIIAPDDETLAPLRHYLARPPAIMRTPPDMEQKLDEFGD